MPRSRRLLLASAFVALPLPLLAQGTETRPTSTSEGAAGAEGLPATASVAPSDPDLARAYKLVMDGRGAAGRALVDSLLAAAPEASPRYAEVLYWRAAFAASTADAERDYRRLSVEYPLSPRAADALIALAQLEYVRNDKTLAVHHLQRLMIEHPAGVRSAKANFWAARVLFDARDPARACSALRAARSTAAADEVELRNQIEFELPKCRAGVNAATASREPAADDNLPAARSAPPASTRGAPSAASAGQGSRAGGAKPATTTARPSTPGARAGFAVQVAAYRSKAEANALAAKLTGRGYTAARVVGTTAPYRVHVGRYGTRAEAAAALKRMQAAKLSGFVVETGAR